MPTVRFSARKLLLLSPPAAHLLSLRLSLKVSQHFRRIKFDSRRDWNRNLKQQKSSPANDAVNLFVFCLRLLGWYEKIFPIYLTAKIDVENFHQYFHARTSRVVRGCWAAKGIVSGLCQKVVEEAAHRDEVNQGIFFSITQRFVPLSSWLMLVSYSSLRATDVATQKKVFDHDWKRETFAWRRFFWVGDSTSVHAPRRQHAAAIYK